MSDTTALDSFLDKWRSRWPEWQVTEVFVPQSQRQLAVAWFALLQEFEDAMNIAGDPLPADAKLAWWGEELRDWARRRSRHPLGRVLEPHVAPWFELAESLPVLIELRRTQASEAAMNMARPLAEAIAAVELALFAGEDATGDAIATHANDVAVALLASRLSLQPQRSHSIVLPRRLLMAILRLRAESPDKAPSQWRILWRSWRAARG